MPTNPDSDLMRIFDFTAEDLEMNRAGRMSERQAQKLSEKIKKERLSNILFAIVVAVVMLVIVFSQVDTHKIEWVFIILILFLLTLVLLSNYVDRTSLSSDVKSGTVRFVEGTIKMWQGRDRQTIRIAKEWLNIDGKESSNLKRYLQKIPKATQFRVYYAPKTYNVVSMEIIAP